MGVPTPRQSYGQVGVLHIIATADEPMTAKEIEEHIDKGNASNYLVKLYRSGYVLRRRREVEGRGTNPYEYTLAPRDSF